MKTTTNVFKFKNLDDLHTKYDLWRIRSKHPLTESARNKIVKKLSHSFNHPIEIIRREGDFYLVVMSLLKGNIDLSTSLKHVNNEIYFSKAKESLVLDYSNPDPEIKKICLRFLQFSINGCLFQNHKLWLPKTGAPFYNYNPYSSNGIDIFKGFSLRIIELPGSEFGISLDVTRKYVSKIPLDKYLNRNQFITEANKKSYLYKYPGSWYEVKPTHFSDLVASEVSYTKGGKKLGLLEDLRAFHSGVSLPADLADLPEDASIINYKTSTDGHRSVPAGLCYEVFDTDNFKIRKLHNQSIIDPQRRFKEIRIVRDHYLNKLKMGNQALVLESKTWESSKKYFNPPNFEFGNNFIVPNSKDFEYSEENIEKLGKLKLEAFSHPDIGAYAKSIDPRLGTQILVLPRSVSNKMGFRFKEMLEAKVDTIFESETGYHPELIIYEDKVSKQDSYYSVGRNIISEIQKKHPNSSVMPKIHALIMLPDIKRKKRRHDEIAALVMNELNNINIQASIIHSSATEKAFYPSTRDGKTVYRLKDKARGKFNSYLHNVALNKVLLNNGKYPFCFSSELYADLTIGIDIKKNTAGYTFIDKQAKVIRTKLEEHHHDYKEKLTSDQIFREIAEVVKDFVKSKVEIKKITIHRDGRLFESEIEGIKKLYEVFKKMGIQSITVLEIQKSSFVPMRIFQTSKDQGKLENPTLGTYLQTNNNTAYIATTGKGYLRNGTSNPLCVRYHPISNELQGIPFLSALRDLYHLSHLTFTKIDSCMRIPISIKLTDNRLDALASEYDIEEYNNLVEVEKLLQ